MKKVHKETEQVLLEHEKQVLKDLEKAYVRCLADIKKRVRQLMIEIDMLEKADVENKSLIRAKIYQLNYQKSLEKQIKAIMGVLNDSSVSTTETFLKQMYEDGYLTQLYVIQSFGIPVIAPINVEKMLKAVNMKVDGFKFSKRMYDDIQELAKATIEEITNGLGLGKSYIDIASNISRRTEATLKQAYTIARTEGGRVSSMAKIDSQKDAKKLGADIVKIWDSTLDGKTRPQHQQLDQQTKEIGEDFEIDGYKAPAPRMFGVPWLDINCRCTSLTVPRWDITPTITKRDGVSGELIECKNYFDWKEKYYKEINK